MHRRKAIVDQEKKQLSKSKWKKMFDGYYGNNNQFEAIAKLNAHHQTKLFPTKYDNVVIDEQVIKDVKSKKQSLFNYQNGKLILYVNDKKILVCVEQIASGSEGVVWRAQDTETKKWYAVKIPNESETTSTLKFNQAKDTLLQVNESFLKEIEIIGKDEQLIYIPDKKQTTGLHRWKLATPMDFAEGYTLEKYMLEKIKSKPGSKITLADFYECLCIFIATIEKVKQIHDKGRIHHDLKPANIQIDPYTGKITILDLESAPRINYLSDKRMITPSFSEKYHYSHEVDNITPSYDIFSLGVMFGAMLKMFTFKHIPEGIEVLQKDLKVSFNPENYDSACLEFAKKLDDYIRSSMLGRNPEGRASTKDIKEDFQKLAKECYEKLLKDRTQLHKIGIIDLDEILFVNEEGQSSINRNVIPALQSLDGCYIYTPSLGKDANDKIQQLLILCNKENIPLRGIIGDKDIPQISPGCQISPEMPQISPELPQNSLEIYQDSPEISHVSPEISQSSPKIAHVSPKISHDSQEISQEKTDEFKLPLHLNLAIDGIRERIDQIETPVINFSQKPLQPVNMYFWVTGNELYETEKRAIHAHNMGYLSATSKHSVSYYRNSAQKQMQSILVEDKDYDKICKNLRTKLGYFEEKVKEFEAKQDQAREQNKEFSNTRELSIYQYEAELTRSLLDKIDMQQANGQLTYQTLINSLQAYRLSFHHSNSIKGFFCSLFGLEHGTKSAKEIEKSENDLRKAEATLKNSPKQSA